MKPIYSVVRWNETYENNRSRAIQTTSWVPVPNKHDGEGFRTVMAHEKSAEIFAAWILILQVSSKCAVRGVLVRDDGRPHDAQSLAIKTNGKKEWFESALEVLSSVDVGWVSVECSQCEQEVTPGCRQGDVGVSFDILSKKEGKERTEQNGIECETPPKPKRFVKPTPDQITAYMIERNWKSPNGQKFYDYYESNGWVRGKSRIPIKDWQASVRTWEANMKPEDFISAKRDPVCGVDYDLMMIAGEEFKVIPGSDELFDEESWRSA